MLFFLFDFFFCDLDFFRHTAELLAGMFDLVLGFHTLPTVHSADSLQSSAGPAGKGGHHIEIAQEFVHRGGWRMRLDLLLRF
jgi:hypothetical protein